MQKSTLWVVGIFAVVTLIGCRVPTATPAINEAAPSPHVEETETEVVDSTAASTPTSSATDTPTATQTLTPEATETKTATPLPPTATPAFLLPEELAPIVPENVDRLEQIAVIPVDEIYLLAFSRDGKRIVTLSDRWKDRSRFMTVWALETGEQILFLDQLPNPWTPFFSPDGTDLYLTYNHRGFEKYNLEAGKLIGVLDLPAHWSAVSPDRNYIAAGDWLGTPEESTVRVIEFNTGEEIFTLRIPGEVRELQFSPDGRFLTGGFAASTHFRDFVWEAQTGKKVTDLLDYEFGLTFSPDSELAATAKNGRVSIFFTDTWVLAYTYGFTDPYSNVKPRGFSETGEILLAEDRNDLLFLDPPTGAVLSSLPDTCNGRFSPDGKIVVSWCYQGELTVWGVKP